MFISVFKRGLLFLFFIQYAFAQSPLKEIITAYQDFQEANRLQVINRVIGLTENDYQCRLAFYRGLIEKIHSSVNKENLAGQDFINYEILAFILQDKIAHIEMKNYLVPINAEGGWYTYFASSMGNREFSNREDYYQFIDEMNDFVFVSERYTHLLKKGISQGRTLPLVIAKNHKLMLEMQIVSRIEESPFFIPFIRLPNNVTNEQKEILIKQGRKAVKSVNNTYKQLYNFFDKIYLAHAHKHIGIKEQSNGTAVYEQRIRYYTTSSMTAKDVYELGKKEVARIKKEMESTLNQLGFERSLSDFIKYLREDPQFYATDSLQLLKEASFIAKKIDGVLPKYFLQLPRNSYGVVAVPSAIAPHYTSGRYSGGDLSEGKSGSYWVNTTKLHARPLYNLPSLTLHEAVPGHHLQNALAQEMEDVPNFRNELYLSSFGEGWALYAEFLGEEMGIYTTLYERFGKLVYEMWRACRLVVDPGMHMFGMTRQEAINFLTSHTALSLHECTTEIDRYIGWPGQAVSYKIGELKIRELRAYAKYQLGEAFDLRTFHHIVLKNGSIPLFTLDRIVREWVEKQR